MKAPKPLSTRLRFCQRRLDNRLIAYTFGPKPSAFVTPFFQSATLKQRILMLQKSETSRWAIAKYGFATLLIASLFVFVAACEDQSKKEVVSTEPITVSGQIFGSNDKPIPGANIVLKGSQTGTSTDANGEYQFNVPGNGTLVVSFVGHQSIEVPVNGRDALYVRLAQPTDGTPSTYWTGTPKIPKHVRNSHITDLLDRKPVDDGNGEIFTVVEQNPEFPGGIANLGKYLSENIRYPEAAKRAQVSGRVFVSFVVNTDGSIQDIQILKGIGFGADEEAVRVIKAMPRWKPAMQDGKVVRVKYNLPIRFELAEAPKTTAAATEDDGKMDPKFYEEIRQDYNRFVVNGKSVSFDEYVQQDQYAYKGSFDTKNKTVYISVKTPSNP
ncbi:TonB family protein [Larkinella bovis]|uniref:TonB family protein n=1 Tax=Larkinella bovis TaxID=683041 RepID=A0ABW0IDL7_9BACT